MNAQVTGRRGAVVRNAILAAALDEVADTGYDRFTMEGVAARVGVHKTTVYRRWPDRESLLTSAVLEQVADDFDLPDTGDLDRDVRDAMRARVAWLTGPYGRPLVMLFGSDAGRLPGVRAAVEKILSVRHDLFTRRLRAAADAGQIPADTDPILMLTTLIAPIYLSLLVTGLPVTSEDADRAAAVALAAARAGLLGTIQHGRPRDPQPAQPRPGRDG